MTSPVVNVDAICVALAARFAAATIGTPTGADAMRVSHPGMPKGVPVTPCHLLEMQDGSVVANPGQWKHELNIDGVLLLAKRPGDPARVEKQRRLWLPYLLHATVDALKITLGGGAGYTVDKAIPTSWEWTEYSVSDNEFDAIRVRWVVYVTENVSLTA